MNLNQLKSAFKHYGCSRLYIKKLSPNDNSKNQVYLGGSFEVLNILPISSIETEPAGNWERERFKAKLSFAWIAENGSFNPAPHAQLILYPKYPEVRFSGFLNRCVNAPSHLMIQRLAGRLLFFGISNTGKVYGYVTAPNSVLSHEIGELDQLQTAGIFSILEITDGNNRQELLTELKRINNIGWIDSKRLDKSGNIVPCNAPNCGGYTLEAELGIIPNGYSDPDYLGWEIKQFGVSNFQRLDSAIITLMTPEPTGGYYQEHGAEAFVKKYGYPDKMGRDDRMNFGGIHKIEEKHSTTNLTMQLIGFDRETQKIRNVDGRIALVDEQGNEAATWNFASLLTHWNRKHNQACYIPSMSNMNDGRKYFYGNKVILGIGTDFQLFVAEMGKGNIYYDPGVKVENISTRPKVKKRNQFRIKSRFLSNLYRANELVDINE